MRDISKLTTRGQVTIPLKIREMLSLRPSDKVIFLKKGKDIVVKPVRVFLNLKGSVKTKRKYSDEESDESVLKYL